MHILYIKSVMAGAGYLLDPAPGEEWSLAEEKAWAEICAIMGLRYTPYPDLNGQDPSFVERIHRQTWVLVPAYRSPLESSIDLKQLLPMPTKVPAESPKRIIKEFATLSDVPGQFGMRKVARVVDPLDGLEPNPITKTRPVRMNPEKAARLKQIRAEAETQQPPEAPKPEVEKPTPKQIRVR